MNGDSQYRLAVYGSLAPDAPNNRLLEGIDGSWEKGTVRGRLIPHGWGNGLGFPALIPDPGEASVPVHVFTSTDLPANWARLDAFEGDQYQRVLIDVEVDDGRSVVANIYAASVSAG